MFVLWRSRWALVKDRDVARKMTKFIEVNTIGVSKDSQLRAAKIMGIVSDGYESPSAPPGEERFFSYSRRLMAARWRRLQEAVGSTSSFSLPEFPSPVCRFSGEKSELHPGNSIDNFFFIILMLLFWERKLLGLLFISISYVLFITRLPELDRLTAKHSIKILILFFREKITIIKIDINKVGLALTFLDVL